MRECDVLTNVATESDGKKLFVNFCEKTKLNLSLFITEGNEGNEVGAGRSPPPKPFVTLVNFCEKSGFLKGSLVKDSSSLRPVPPLRWALGIRRFGLSSKRPAPTVNTPPDFATDAPPTRLALMLQGALMCQEMSVERFGTVDTPPIVTPAELEEQTGKAVASLLRWPGVRRIWLFGSAARGGILDWRSDLDFAVEGLAPEHWEGAWATLDEAVPLPVDLVRFESADSALRDAILREGRMLYEA